MNQQEQIADYETSIRSAINGSLKGVWTALPCIIVSFDKAAMTCTAQPAIQGVVTNQDRTKTLTDLPLLVDVPVQYPQGGGCVMTFPIAPGDECLVIFSSRHIDSWWDSGGVQPPMSPRMHDLSDGMAIVGFFSRPRVPAGVSSSRAELRDMAGTTAVGLDPATKIVTIVAPGGVQMTTPLLKVSGDVVAGANNVSLTTHRHSNVSTGSGTSGIPV